MLRTTGWFSVGIANVIGDAISSVLAKMRWVPRVQLNVLPCGHRTCRRVDLSVHSLRPGDQAVTMMGPEFGWLTLNGDWLRGPRLSLGPIAKRI